MRDEQDGDPARPDVLDELPGVAAGARVEPGGQFVEDDDPGVADEGERDEQALFLAAGELREAGGELGGQAEAFGEGPPVGGVRIEGRVQLQGFADGELGLELALLELGAEDAGDLFVVGDGVEPGDPDAARVGIRRPSTHSTVVVLPAVGPRIPKISPSSTAKETPSTRAGRRRTCAVR